MADHDVAADNSRSDDEEEEEACQAGIPLDSRLLRLAVQRDWAHVILVLCSKQAS